MSSLRYWLALTHSNGVVYGLKQANLVSYVGTQLFNYTYSISKKIFKNNKIANK